MAGRGNRAALLQLPVRSSARHPLCVPRPHGPAPLDACGGVADAAFGARLILRAAPTPLPHSMTSTLFRPLAATAFLLCLTGTAHAQITGTVRDAATGLPLPGATVRIVGTPRAASAGADGAFRIDGVGAGRYTAAASYVGYSTMQAAVTVGSDGMAPVLAFSLSSNDVQLSTVLAETDRPRSAASSETVRALDLLVRPTRSAQDLLRLAPGVVTAQHAGGGKAEQIFIRGFDADHGTDINVSVDGVPVNMVSHGHGQGYADLHFVIPETVERIDVNKGPYRAEDGNLATGGAIGFATKERLTENLVRVQGGAFRSLDATALVGLPIDDGATSGYLAGQFIRTDGPFDASQDFHRVNVFGKLTREIGNGGGRVSLTASSFTSAWDASGQIPQRAVDSGLISRFGSIDDGEGGATSREDVNVRYASSGGAQGLDVQAYAVRYRFKLFSNFTLFLDDPIRGDMIEQRDLRSLRGVNARYRRPHRLGDAYATASIGATARADGADVALSHSPDRVRDEAFVDSHVEERNVSLWAEEDVSLSTRLRIIAGLRTDYFTFDVDDRLEGIDTGRPHVSGHRAVDDPQPQAQRHPLADLDASTCS